MYTHVYTCMYTYLYACKHMYVYKCIHRYTHVYTCIHMYSHVCIHMCTHVCMNYGGIHMYTHVYTCIHMYTHVYTCIYKYIHVYTYICLHIYICKYIYTQIYIYVYTHIHKYIYIYIHIFSIHTKKIKLIIHILHAQIIEGRLRTSFAYEWTNTNITIRQKRLHEPLPESHGLQHRRYGPWTSTPSLWPMDFNTVIMAIYTTLTEEMKSTITTALILDAVFFCKRDPLMLRRALVPKRPSS